MTHLRRIVVVLVMLGCLCEACSLAEGHFHQVTAIRGRVVGSSWARFRWLRQSFSVNDATLALYEYRAQARLEDRKRIAIIQADSKGYFDFGSIPKGHYSLHVGVKDSDRMGAWFDVEITDAVRTTKDITIDASPIHPDCTGCNEFIERKS
ncbi:MAG TPA: hypothetical protein VMH04_00300 [Candidatus Solibacter sp.]|nr:hypothetical protein [Candidatus Solibacter sp.]